MPGARHDGGVIKIQVVFMELIIDTNEYFHVGNETDVDFGS